MMIYLVSHEFKPDLHFVEINCFPDKFYKLVIELSSENVKFSTISKKPEIDFSLYDYCMITTEDAEKFLLNVKEKGWSLDK